jgi:hypothetical protein
MAAMMSRADNQSVENNDPTSVIWQTEVLNRGLWSAGQPTRLTVPAGEAGIYEISAGIEWEADNDGVRIVELVLNDTTSIKAVNQQATQGVVTLQGVATEYPLVADDYITVLVRHTAGNALNVIGGDQYTNFRMVRVSA